MKEEPRTNGLYFTAETISFEEIGQPSKEDNDGEEL